MLSKNTQAVINQLKDISPSVIFTYPITGIRDANKTIIAFVELNKIGESEFEEFGIIKVREFMDLLDLAGEDANIELNNSIININSTNLKCKYVTSNVIGMENTFRTKPTMLENVEKAEASCTFTLTTNELNRIKKLSALLGLENFNVISSEDGVKIVVKNTSINTKSEGNEFEIEVPDAIVNTPSNILLGINNVRKLPMGDYDVKVALNGANAIIRFTSKNVAGLTIFISTKIESHI